MEYEFHGLLLNNKIHAVNDLHVLCDGKVNDNRVPEWEKNVYAFILEWIDAKDYIVQKASLMASKISSDINIAGYHSGYFDETENHEIIHEINESGAEILILGMGVPRQELWSAENKMYLTNIKIIIAGGAIIDFISHEIKRAPLWLRRMNLEWLFRFYLEPKRMWKRYVLGNFKFLYYIFRLRFGNTV